MTPETRHHGDAALRLGRRFIDRSAGVQITPKRKNADGSITVQVSVASDTANAPAVSSLSAAPSGLSATLSASISDADGGDLAYYWDFGDGNVDGGIVSIPNGDGSPRTITASHTWIATRDYRVRLTVTDMRGHVTSKSVMVQVGSVTTVRLTGRVLDVFGNPVQDVRVVGNTAVAYTDTDGSYTFPLEPSLLVNLTASKPGWTFTTPGFTNPLQVSPDPVGIDFRGTFGGYAITGTATLPGGIPLPGVLVTRGTQTEVTGADGTFNLSGLDNGKYEVTFAKAGYTFPPQTVTVDFANANRLITADGVSYSVSGLFLGAVPADTVAQVYLSYGAITRSVFPLSTPNFSFMVPAGTWYLSATGLRDVYQENFVPSGGWTNPLVVDGPKTGINFTYHASNYSVRGRITDAGQPLAGVNVSAGAGFSAVTDTLGGYAITGLPPGNRTLTPTLAGKAFLPQTITVQANSGGNDFITANPPPNANPTVPTAAAAEPFVGSRTATWLTIAGDDDQGANRLKYRWSLASSDPPGLPAPDYPFIENAETGTNSAKRILARFSRAGTYVMRAEVKDERGLAYLADPNDRRNEVTVVVTPVLSSLRVKPRHGADPGWTAVEIPGLTGREFVAIEWDQFAFPMPTQSVKFRWSVAGGGGPSVDAYGVFTAGAVGWFEGVVADTDVAGGGTMRGGAAVLSYLNGVAMNNAVTGRHVFYNNSAFDGNNAAANLQDDDARDTGKSALLPGSGNATFSNYTSFSKGLNGIMFDLSWTGGTLTPEDIVLRVGNQATSTPNAADNDPTWWRVPATPTISIRDKPGGPAGSKRVTLIWPDYDVNDPTSIARAAGNRWLRVSVLHTTRTGLPAQDVFFFGNLIGDTGNNTSGTYATLAEDYSATKAVADDPAQDVASVISRFDHNRDGVHDSLDYLLIPPNYFKRLYLLNVPG